MTTLAVLSELLQLAWVAPLAVFMVAGSYGFGMLGATRAGEQRREGRAGSAAGYLALAVLSGLVFIGSVGAGLYVIISG